MDPKLEAAHRKLTDRVMGKPGVAGTAVGEKSGAPCLLVYVAGPEGTSELPGAVDGFPVVVKVTGSFRAHPTTE